MDLRLRRLFWHPIVRLIFDKTEDGLLKWDKEDYKSSYVAEDGGLRFQCQEKAYFQGHYYRITVFNEDGRRISEKECGAKALYQLIQYIKAKPIESANEERLAKYIRESQFRTEEDMTRSKGFDDLGHCRGCQEDEKEKKR